MEQQSPSNLKKALNSRLAEMASLLADEGREFNRHLLRQFEEWEISEEQASWSVVQAEEHLLLLKAVAHTLGWLESRVISRAPRARWSGQEALSAKTVFSVSVGGKGRDGERRGGKVA